MKWQLELNIPDAMTKIHHSDPLMLIGSCFTTQIGKQLEGAFFNVLTNPAGIVFDPLSICRHLYRIMDNIPVNENDLFLHEELYRCWDFHSEYSHTDREKALEQINSGIRKSHKFLHEAKWLVITLGTSFAYRLIAEERMVANCHKVPAEQFEKKLISPADIVKELQDCLGKLKATIPSVNIILTISPVRHVRDGIVENNRSKAHLIQAVHQLCYENSSISYFPAYELVIDVLRDYRFYDDDLVHPNQMAARFVFEKFCQSRLDSKTLERLPALQQLAAAMNHRLMHPETNAGKNFLKSLEEKKELLKKEMPWITFKPTENRDRDD